MNLLLNCIQSVILKLNKKYIIDEDTLNIANESHLLPFLYLSMDKNTNPEIRNKVVNLFNSYILYDSMQQEELNSLKKLFNDNNINYAILKGERLQRYYPETVLRYMCDIDILVEKKNLKRVDHLLKEKGYTKGDFSNHDITYNKNPLHIEIHYKLITEKIFGSEYFKDPFSLMKRIEDSFEYEFIKKEDEYIYILFHLLKHYETSGIGLRNFIDLYLYKKNNNLDMKYIEDSYKYTSFIDDCYYLNEFIDDLFNDDNTHEELIERILNNKTFGTTQEQTKNELENRSTFKWLLRKMFPSISQMKNYKCLKYKIGYILLPLLYIHHIFYFGIVKFKYSINRIKLAKRIKQQK